MANFQHCDTGEQEILLIKFIVDQIVYSENCTGTQLAYQS